MIGRFQPFHNGHLMIVKKALEDCAELIIGIGSAQSSHTIENPFTSGERFEMILRTLKNEKIQNCHIVPIVDVNRCGIWVAHVLNILPKFEVYYSNNQTDIRLFKEAGIKVCEPGLVEREHLEGSKLRQMMLEGQAWKKHVPSTVAEVIDEIDGISRLRAVSYATNRCHSKHQ